MVQELILMPVMMHMTLIVQCVRGLVQSQLTIRLNLPGHYIVPSEMQFGIVLVGILLCGVFKSGMSHPILG